MQNDGVCLRLKIGESVSPRERSLEKGIPVNSMTKTLVALVAISAGAGSALADGRVQINDGTGFYDGTNGSGGAFQAQWLSGYNGIGGGNGQTGSNFLTFCIEENEFLGFGGQYYTQIATTAMNGGVSGGGPGGDPLDAATAKIYREFRAGGNFGGVGTFSDGYNTSDETSAIQYAIWSIEGEMTLGNDSISLLAADLVTWASNNNGSIGNVRVMRLWDTYQNGVYSGNHQDLLTLVPLPPAAWAGLGTLTGVAGLGFLRRRKLAAQ